MIQTEDEYQESVRRRDSEKSQLEEHRKNLESRGLTSALIEKAMQPYESFRLQLVDEIKEYERIKRGNITDTHNLCGIGKRLIAIRIQQGLSQQEFAEKLGIDESLVCSAEKNEYHGITVQRVERILTTFGVSMTSSFDFPKPKRTQD